MQLTLNLVKGCVAAGKLWVTADSATCKRVSGRVATGKLWVTVDIVSATCKRVSGRVAAGKLWVTVDIVSATCKRVSGRVSGRVAAGKLWVTVDIDSATCKRVSGRVSGRVAAGKLWVFKALMDSVGSRARLAELCTRHIVPKAAFVDLLFLFSPRRMTLEAYAPEYFDRMKVRNTEYKKCIHPIRKNNFKINENGRAYVSYTEYRIQKTVFIPLGKLS